MKYHEMNSLVKNCLKQYFWSFSDFHFKIVIYMYERPIKTNFIFIKVLKLSFEKLQQIVQ